MKRPLTVQPEERERTPIEMASASLWPVLGGAGLAVMVVGWVDLTLLWFPLNFGSPDWEFGTVAAHLDGMPLGTVGLTLLIAASIAQGWRRATRLLAAWCLFVTLWLVVITVVYVLNLPLALETTSQQAASSALGKAILKAGAFAATYMVLYAWLTWFLWRLTRLGLRF